MKYNILYIFIVIILVRCSNDQTSSVSGNNLTNKDRFILPTLPGDYEPKGLRKLSIIEMKKIGESEGIPTGIVYKDQKGKVVSPEYYGLGPDARFVQFYANSTGKIEEAVVYEISNEMKAVLMLMRLSVMPVEN